MIVQEKGPFFRLTPTGEQQMVASYLTTTVRMIGSFLREEDTPIANYNCEIRRTLQAHGYDRPNNLPLYVLVYFDKIEGQTELETEDIRDKLGLFLIESGFELIYFTDQLTEQEIYDLLNQGLPDLGE